MSQWMVGQHFLHLIFAFVPLSVIVPSRCVSLLRGLKGDDASSYICFQGLP